MKNCTPLWRDAGLEVKMIKAPLSLGALLDVEMSKKCTLLQAQGILHLAKDNVRVL
jgi:hypothetical protein